MRKISSFLNVLLLYAALAGVSGGKNLLCLCPCVSQVLNHFTQPSALGFQGVTNGSCCHVIFTHKYLFLCRLSGRRQDVVSFNIWVALEQ